MDEIIIYLSIFTPFYISNADFILCIIYKFYNRPTFVDNKA